MPALCGPQVQGIACLSQPPGDAALGLLGGMPSSRPTHCLHRDGLTCRHPALQARHAALPASAGPAAGLTAIAAGLGALSLECAQVCRTYTSSRRCRSTAVLCCKRGLLPCQRAPAQAVCQPAGSLHRGPGRRIAGREPSVEQAGADIQVCSTEYRTRPLWNQGVSQGAAAKGWSRPPGRL